MKDKSRKRPGHKRKEFNGPYFVNNNSQFETTRKYMKTYTEGPTVDEFSYQDPTDCIDISDLQPPKRHHKRPRKKQTVIKNWWNNNRSEIIAALVATAITSFLGIVIYKHSNHLVAHDKDIEYIKEKENDLKEDIQKIDFRVDNIKDKVHEIDKKVDIQEVRIQERNE